MDSMEDKLNSILGDPKMMQQIMALAQSLGQNQDAPPDSSQTRRQDAPSSPLADFDPMMLKNISTMAGQSSIDANQRSLLKALGPYLHQDRIRKLEKAMRAAKLASAASSAFSSGALSFLTGR